MKRILRSLVVAPVVAAALSTVLAPPAGAADLVLWIQGSPSFMPAGVAIYNVATVGLGVNPTGTLTSSLYGPNDATCSRPAIFTASTPVSGNGNYQSPWYTTSAAGSYRWVAAYSGDAAHPATTTACADPRAEVVVGKRTPTLAVAAALIPTTGSTTATATLDKGAGLTGPKGTISFRLYGPNNPTCGGAPVFTSTRSVSGNGTYTSNPYVPTAAGTYQWVLSYSGDDDNWGAFTVCIDPAGAVVATPRLLTPTLALAPTPADGRRGEPVRATASLGAGAVPTGTITFKLFGPRDAECAERPVATSSVAVSGNGTYTSAPYTPPGPGTYRWVASYDGDIAHVPVATTCAQRDSTTAVAQVTDDYDGDGDTDVAIFRPSNGGWYPQGTGGVAWGVAGDIPVPGDYNGDGRTDVAVYRPSNGGWYVNGMGTVAWGGVPGDVPVPGDYNGDGATDVAVYRPSNGGWYLKGIGEQVWGATGDVPVPGDYDGDGDTDVAVYRPSNGGWYVPGASVVAWGGVTGDIPVPGDYNGDGRTDVAIYRPSNGGWYLHGLGSVVWGGVTGDVPVPGDYNGDGATDPAVYRPADGGWYRHGIGAVAWGGVQGDVALTLPAAIRRLVPAV